VQALVLYTELVGQGHDDPRGIAHPVGVDKAEREWRPGERILVTLPDGQVVRCPILSVDKDGGMQVVPEHEVVFRPCRRRRPRRRAQRDLGALWNLAGVASV
jgi:hypothetical protein